MSMTTVKPVVGFIGLGDQGLPMATAIVEAGYPLHVWARRTSSLDVLGDIAHVRHSDSNDLASSCDIVALCVSTDEDVMQIVTSGLLEGLRPGSVIVNHGTGTPGNAVRLTEMCARAGVDVLDAPVSGGRPAAQARTLTTMVGGPQPVAQRCEPLLRSFSRHVVYLGGPGAGQTAKLFNNALLMMNQANIADIIELAIQLGMNPSSLVDVLKLGSASSNALTLLNSMVRLDNVDHLSSVEALDMHLFDTAMIESGVNADFVTSRGLAGASGLPTLLRQLNS
ncbi:NAD(P)-dependent oxidoreductase [Dictyobacter aurantiacus]|uniref:6-phosphogluconate dehydrogenase n=1 Tax=Dictyobacter aurantiacus TaxID=1936993 RepID=A0A401ZMX6_9CHLR|nr:NAD(P)-dependent oxidoreductase [Dictyobacter aurantiacus]GCE08203.1 6-phosphogluconate dehydrogenase [Dictyobacter aurantiacus]